MTSVGKDGLSEASQKLAESRMVREMLEPVLTFRLQLIFASWAPIASLLLVIVCASVKA